jgi:hypothetical protein
MKRLVSVASNGDYPQPLQSTWGFSDEVVNSSTHIKGFKILGKIFFSGPKTPRKNISSYSVFITKKVFTFGGWVG